MKPTLTIGNAVVYHGSNLDVLPTLPDNSVDSIVTDPPYELGFMGKKWDSSGIAYSVELWTECMRVLKPGGHLLAFGGSRTWHRLAVAIEDAGFEIRDSIAWLYGSGFPKSMDIAKAIDKSDATEARRKRDLAFTAWMRLSDLSQSKCAHLLLPFAKNKESAAAMAQHYYTDKTQPAVPTAELFDRLRPYLPEVPDYIERLVAERTVESENFKKREVIGQKTAGMGSGKTFGMLQSEGENAIAEKEIDITAPATEEAKKWAGWGTALKPAFEPVVVARKPLGGEVVVRTIIENELKKLGFSEIKWTKLVNGATKPNQKQTFGSTDQLVTAATFAKNVNASVMQNIDKTTEKCIKNSIGDLNGIIQGEAGNLAENLNKNLKTKSLKPMEKSVNAVENQTGLFSPLTISTVAELNTEEKPAEKSGINLEETDFLKVTESFAGIVTGLSGSQATVHINLLSDGSFEWPDGLPEVVKIGNTVAENVLTWGVGGLNIDGSRIAGEIQSVPQPNTKGGVFSGEQGRSSMMSDNTKGRWPANIILDEYTAGLLDEQSGNIKSGKIEAHHNQSGKEAGVYGAYSGLQTERGYGDSGGASRFFYVAKASKKDRNEGLEKVEAQSIGDKGNGLARTCSTCGASVLDGCECPNRTFVNPERKNFHPTVKPTAIMEYLIKLVTPPNGTVLDPFTGSGSTGKAALLNGFKFIGIELTEEYLPIIEGRLTHASQAKEEEESETLF